MIDQNKGDKPKENQDESVRTPSDQAERDRNSSTPTGDQTGQPSR